MTINYSEQLHKVLTYSTQEAERLGNNYVGPEHLLLGLLRNGSGKAIEILNHSNVNLLRVKQSIESQIRTDIEPSGQEIPLLKSTERIKKIMELETRSLASELAELRENFDAHAVLILATGPSAGVFAELQSAFERLWRQDRPGMPSVPWWNSVKLHLRAMQAGFAEYETPFDASIRSLEVELPKSYYRSRKK